MHKTLFTNVGQLVNTREHDQLLRGKSLADLPVIRNAWLLVEDTIIADYGSMDQVPTTVSSIDNTFDLTGRLLLPAWCDSHTHLVFAATREEEFVHKIRGLTYAEIAAKGGGILNSAAKLKETSEEELFLQAWK